MADVTTGMWIGNKLVSNVYMGNIPSTTSAPLAKLPLYTEYIIVGGGSSGHSTNGQDGGVGGDGGGITTGSYSFSTLYNSASINVGAGAPANPNYPPQRPNVGGQSSNITITGSLIYSGQISGGSGGQGGVYGQYLCSNGGDGKVWVDGNKYAPGGGGGSPSPYSTGCGGGGGLGYGSGGQGGSWSNGGGSGGGDGVVIFRYISNVPLASGGTITSSSGYIYHTFNSGSGTFTYL